MAFIAKFDGMCVACGLNIKAEYHEIRRSYSPDGYRHVNCSSIAKRDYFVPAGEWPHLPKFELNITSHVAISDLPPDIEATLELIRQKMNSLTDIRTNFLEDMHFFEETGNMYKEIIRNNLLEEEEELNKIKKEYRARREGFEESYNSVASEVSSLTVLIDDVERTIEEERAKHGKLIELYTVHKEIEELKKEFAAIMAAMPWADSMKGYQEDDILHSLKVWRDNPNQGILNANPMGLGKTYEAGAFIDIFREMFRAEHNGRSPRILWLTRKSLIGGSMDELSRWNGDRKAVPVVGNPQMRELYVQMAIANDLITMANYEAMRTTPLLKTIDWDLVVIDEVHHLKGGALSTPTQIWKDTQEIVGIIEDKENSYYGHKSWKKTDNAPFAYFISGSPMQNKPEEMWAYLNLYNPKEFPSVREFKDLFAPYGSLLTGRLLEALKGRMIRNDPDKVGIDRPEKQFSWRYVELTAAQRELYDQVKDYILNVELAGEDRQVNLTHIFSVLTRAWQVVLWPPAIEFKTHDGLLYGPNVRESAKIDEAMEIITELQNDNQQAVVWSSRFNPPLYEMARRLQGEQISYGLMTKDAKDLHDIESKFQQGEIDVLLCQRMSVGEGFNFQKAPDKWPGGASHAIKFDRWWNPPGNAQMEDRIWRIDVPKKMTVTIHELVAERTVDQFILQILKEKDAFIDPVMKSEKLRPMSEWRDMLAEMI